MRDEKKLIEKIKKKKVKIAVIGLGYVGIPLSLLFAKNKFYVTGFVRSKEKVKKLLLGESYIQDKDLKKNLKEEIKLKTFDVKVISDDDLENNDVFIICVPTPVDENKKPDLSDLESVAKRLSQINLTNKLIINESTVAPFTTEKVLGNIGKDYFLVCSPERIDPGNKSKTTETIAKVIGGKDFASLELAKTLYSQVLKRDLVVVGSLEAAEMAKMLENTYRAVNIALVNEFAKLAEKINVDILEVLEAAKTKWSFQVHYPSIGVGGHCIPVDPYYVLSLAKDKSMEMKVTEESLKQNETMPYFLADKVQKFYKEGMEVLIYGVTYKKDVADLRESPVKVFCEILKERNIPFKVYDPILEENELVNFGSITSSLTASDIFIVGCDHSQLKEDYKKAIGDNTIVIDGKNFFTKKVGYAVYGIGHNLV